MPADKTTPVLTVRDLHVDIHGQNGIVHAVRGLNLDLEKGETLGIVGESGSGKSMAVFSIMGLLPPGARRRSTRLELCGTELSGLDEAAICATQRGQKATYIFQEPMTALNPVYTIGHQLTQVMRLQKGASKEEARARALHLLDRVGIPDPAVRFNQYPGNFSGGQRQRIMIALALMNSPEVLFADEPTTALDVTVQKQILSLLRELQQEMEMSVVLISHDLGLVSTFCERVMVMNQGEVVETGSATQVLRAPQQDYTRGLVAAIPRGRYPGAMPRAAEKAAPMFELKDVGVRFRVGGSLLSPRYLDAVKGVSLELPKGDSFALVGESGSGKSTLARVMLGMQRPVSGQVLMEGRPLGRLGSGDLARRVQPVFQDPYSSLNPRRTIGELIRRPLDVNAVGTPETRRARVAEVMDLVRLPAHFLQRYPAQLSGGQRQRVAIARALALSPDILVFDEPTSALDVSIQKQILDLLCALRKDLGLTYFLITHNIDVVRYMSDNVAIMKAGQIVEAGTADQVLDNPQQEYSRLLISSTLSIA